MLTNYFFSSFKTYTRTLRYSMINPLTLTNFSQRTQSFGRSIPGVKPPDYDLLKDFKRIRNLPDLTCACCGTQMHNEQDIQNFKYVISHAADKPLIKALTNSMPYMNQTAQIVAKKIIVLAEKNDSADIKELFSMLARGRKIPFLEKQNKKLEAKLKKYMKPDILYNLPKDISSILITAYELSTKKKLNYEKTQENTGLSFIRDGIMQKLQYAMNDYPEYKNFLAAIRSDIHKLDSYYNSADAFILRCEKIKSSEIADLFFDSKTASVEHIIPRSEGGNNNHGNLLIFCRECNVDRDCFDYAKIADTNYGFVSCLKKYLSIIKEHLAKGELKGLEKYPQEVSNTLYRVSQGNIDVEI